LPEPGEFTRAAIDGDLEAELAPLWARAQAGDEAAYREALQAMAARLRGYFARRLQSMPDEVEDLVQETLLALHLRRGTHDAALPVTNWVYAIARHKLVDLWRRRQRREALHEPLDERVEDLLVATNQEFLARRDLRALLQQLPQGQRSAIALLKIEGLSAAEASHRSGVSISALKVRVHRGLKRLAELVRSQK
jgi:RNA polymerase sigma-70 factor (ECF subfamily)